MDLRKGRAIQVSRAEEAFLVKGSEGEEMMKIMARVNVINGRFEWFLKMVEGVFVGFNWANWKAVFMGVWCFATTEARQKKRPSGDGLVWEEGRRG